MSQVLDVDALTRLSNIRAVKPEKADKLEDIIIRNAQAGKFQGKVSEAQMIDLLEQLGGIEKENEIKVTIKKHKFDEEDELDIDNLDL